MTKVSFLANILRHVIMALGASSLMVLALGPSNSLANGDSVEIFSGQDGKYALIVGVQPSPAIVGSIHFTITPLDIQTSLPVDKARILVVAHNPSGKPEYQVTAVNSPLDTRYYDANITIPSPGNWILIIDIQNSRLGHATFEVPLKVSPTAATKRLAATVVWILIVTTIPTVPAILWIKTRRRKTNL